MAPPAAAAAASGSGRGAAAASTSSAAPSAKQRNLPLALLKLPAFLLGVWFMYWSLPLAVLTGFIHAWDWANPRNDPFFWCDYLCHVLAIRFRKRGDGKLYEGPGPVLFLANHRSWADFFIDCYLSGGRAQMLSRMAVLYAFPMFMAPIVMARGCIVFKRNKVHDKEAFNSWIDGQLAASPQAGLLVYPEGHRSTAAKPLPLKRGMLHYAYSRKLPIQIIISAHKELVINEKTYSARFGSTVVTSYSRVLRSADYATSHEFMEAVQRVWDAEWDATFSADAAGLPPLVPRSDVDIHPYPLPLLVSQSIWALVAGALMVASLALSWRWFGAATAWAGPQGRRLIAALLLGWLAASLYACYDTTLPPPMLLPDGSVPGGGAAAKAAAAGRDAAAGGGDAPLVAGAADGEVVRTGSSPSRAANGLHKR